MRTFPLNAALRVLILSVALALNFTFSNAHTVTNLTAEYRNGQVFLTWTNPNATNLQYNVYRSTMPFTSSTQFGSSAFLGFVRDSSSKNFFWTKQTGDQIFYKISNSGQPLSKSKGVYVVTCTNNSSYYYAVTVTKLSTLSEDKAIVAGQNTLSTSVLEVIAEPQPVWQDSVIVANDEVKQHYVQFGDNRETSLYPAMASVGSYGFDFFLIKRGNPSKFALFVLYEGYGKDAEKSVNLEETFGDCYILGIFDWLPVPSVDGKGDDTYFSGYHEKFNFYSDLNPVPVTGKIRLYTQNRILENINWVSDNFSIDENKIYLKGTSSNGYGVLLSAVMFADKIAAAYAIVEPNGLSSPTGIPQQMWGVASSGLKCDVVAWNSTDTLKFKDLTDIHKMFRTQQLRSMPVLYDIHGKNDVSVIWDVNKLKWFDSCENNYVGGVRFWDQRDHGGNNKDYLAEETEPNYYRFVKNKSYPVFSNCSINQNPGSGVPTNGDDYGALNGYLDWEEKIVDQSCKYNLTVFIKDFYVGGVLDPEQYQTCTTDITFRRFQTFNPPIGSVIQWKNVDDNGVKIQSGKITYQGGLIHLKGITVNKTGNLINLKIQNCTAKFDEEDEDWLAEETESNVYFSKSPDGYTAHVEGSADESVEILVYDLLGRSIMESRMSIAKGMNTFEINAPGKGIYLVQILGESFSHSEKLIF